MAYIRKRLDKFTVAVRKRHGQQIYKTFDLKSDALRFAKENLKKLIKKTAYGEKIYIGMGAGSISNWMRNLKNNI